MTRHRSLPLTKTTEELAKWITGNKIDLINHTTKVEYTEDEISEFEHQSSVASRAIDRITKVKDEYMKVFKEGTPGVDADGNPNEPFDITLPPTRGLKALTANREAADQKIEDGVYEEITEIYMIPWPENSKVVGVDILGKEWEQYTRNMTPEEAIALKPLINEANQDKPKTKKEKVKKDGAELFMTPPPKDEDDFLSSLN